MPLPEGYLPREGDVLILHGRVKYDYRNELGDKDGEGKPAVWVRVFGDFHDLRIPFEKIVGVHRRTWSAGQDIRSRHNAALHGRIVASSGDSVWVKLDAAADQKGSQGGHRTFHCDEIEPLPKAGADDGEPDTEARPYPIPEHPGIAPRPTWDSDHGPRPIPPPLEDDDAYRRRILNGIDFDEDERQRIAIKSGLDLDTIGAAHGIRRGYVAPAGSIDSDASGEPL